MYENIDKHYKMINGKNVYDQYFKIRAILDEQKMAERKSYLLQNEINIRKKVLANFKVTDFVVLLWNISTVTKF